MIFSTMYVTGREVDALGDTMVVGRAALLDVLGTVGLDAFLDRLIGRMQHEITHLDPEVTHTRDRDGFHYTKPDLGLIEWMPAIDTGRRVSIKTVAYHPSNPFQRGVPSVLGTIAIYDCTTGALDGLVEGTVLTALRTGAATAVVSDVLAPRRPLTVSMVGCGAQAVTQLHALSRVRPIERVLAYDVAEEVAATIADRVGRVVSAPVELVPSDEHARLLADADVACTCTSVGIGEGPVLQPGPHKPDLHINAVGADFAGKTEIPYELLADALVVPDVTTQCVLEGECQQLEADQIGPSMDLLLRSGAEHPGRHQLSVFDSTGWALEDMVAAELVLDLAAEHGLGQWVDLQSVGVDPFDPYEGAV
ncbi:MAG: ornithine cyclodeaminase family protein [Acidimicrobiia bacterium]|nr:ornithine cyclodeaminase family protein [Acidimicrobiia bacterium]